ARVGGFRGGPEMGKVGKGRNVSGGGSAGGAGARGGWSGTAGGPAMEAPRRPWSKPRPSRHDPSTTRYPSDVDQRGGLAPRPSSFGTTRSCCSQQEIKPTLLLSRPPPQRCGSSYWRTVIRRSQSRASLHRLKIGRRRP